MSYRKLLQQVFPNECPAIPESRFIADMKALLVSGMSRSSTRRWSAERAIELLVFRFGLNGNTSHTTRETAAHFGVSTARIHQVEVRTVRQLRGLVLRMGLPSARDCGYGRVS